MTTNEREELRRVLQSVRPALKNAAATENQRAQFLYDLVREVYDHVKSDVHGPAVDAAERARIGNVLHAALPSIDGRDQIASTVHATADPHPSDGLVNPEDPEYELKVAEWYQRVTDRQQPGDDDPVRITARQAVKLAAIMNAVADGYDSYIPALRAAAWFLECARYAAEDYVEMSTTPAQAWERVEEYPWPRSGPPKPQAL